MSEPLSSVPLFPPIHLSDGAGNWLRCGFQIGNLTCGAFAAEVCKECGPLCQSHQKIAVCFHASQTHQPEKPLVDESRYPVAAILSALNARRITVENGIQRLRSLDAAECIVDAVSVIESGNLQRDYSALLQEFGCAA